ncbi:MAG: hypothetical protein IPH72_34705 [Sandaracinaceae bacterium]|nr:hypothetical protein [Sandaracinaceae bacterium]
MDFRGRHVVSDIVDVGGAPVGLVGVVNGDPGLYRRLPFGGTTLTRPNDAVVAEAARLREQGCVTVIALTHQWLRDDRALAQLGVVALVLGGHEHEGYLETDHPTPLAKAPLNATSAVVADVTPWCCRPRDRACGRPASARWWPPACAMPLVPRWASSTAADCAGTRTGVSA